MDRWSDILDNVVNINKKIKKQQESILDDIDIIRKSRQKITHKRYYVDSPLGEVYFTRREAHCIFYILHGYTIARTALQLELSSRTVEFYLKNIKTKFNIATKAELIEFVMKTNFMEIIDFPE